MISKHKQKISVEINLLMDPKNILESYLTPDKA